MRIPEIARLITSCWICSVPSKMSWNESDRHSCPARPLTCDFASTPSAKSADSSDL
jgi:hypothetical protein